MMEKCETCGHEPRKIKNAFDLLQNIAAGLHKHHMSRVANLEVILYQDNEAVCSGDVQTVLDYLANDLWWNEENEWDGADRAEVRTM
jgi:hypothetical protein